MVSVNKMSIVLSFQPQRNEKEQHQSFVNMNERLQRFLENCLSLWEERHWFVVNSGARNYNIYQQMLFTANPLIRSTVIHWKGERRKGERGKVRGGLPWLRHFISKISILISNRSNRFVEIHWGVNCPQVVTEKNKNIGSFTEIQTQSQTNASENTKRRVIVALLFFDSLNLFVFFVPIPPNHHAGAGNSSSCNQNFLLNRFFRFFVFHFCCQWPILRRNQLQVIISHVLSLFRSIVLSLNAEPFMCNVHCAIAAK